MGIRVTTLVGVLTLFVVGYVYTLKSHSAPSTQATNLESEGGSWFDGLFDQSQKGNGAPNKIPVPGSDILKLKASLQDLQVPCGYIIALSQYLLDSSTLKEAPVNPVDTLLDPSLQLSTITKSAVMNDRYLKILYEEGGKDEFIPAGSLFLRMGSEDATIPSPQLQVVEDEPKATPNAFAYTIRLGKDFMRLAKAKIDLEEREMYISAQGKQDIMVPFLQRRSSPLDDEL